MSNFDPKSGSAFVFGMSENSGRPGADKILHPRLLDRIFMIQDLQYLCLDTLLYSLLIATKFSRCNFIAFQGLFGGKYLRAFQKFDALADLNNIMAWGIVSIGNRMTDVHSMNIGRRDYPAEIEDLCPRFLMSLYCDAVCRTIDYSIPMSHGLQFFYELIRTTEIEVDENTIPGDRRTVLTRSIQSHVWLKDGRFRRIHVSCLRNLFYIVCRANVLFSNPIVVGMAVLFLLKRNKLRCEKAPFCQFD